MNPQLAAWGRRYAAWHVGRHLDGLHVAGAGAVREALQAGPLLVVANHVAWWDGMLALALAQALGAEVGLVARGETLTAYPWMRHFGVFPLHGGLRARASMRAAGAFLDRPQRMLWYFPQGRQRPGELRPLGFQPGISRFALELGAVVLPAALAYPFREVEVPAAAVHFGRPRVGGADAAREQDVIEGLDVIGRWADGSTHQTDASFEALIPTRRGPVQNGVAAALLARVLA